MLVFSHINHVSISPTYGIEPTQRKSSWIAIFISESRYSFFGTWLIILQRRGDYWNSDCQVRAIAATYESNVNSLSGFQVASLGCISKTYRQGTLTGPRKEFRSGRTNTSGQDKEELGVTARHLSCICTLSCLLWRLKKINLSKKVAGLKPYRAWSSLSLRRPSVKSTRPEEALVPVQLYFFFFQFLADDHRTDICVTRVQPSKFKSLGKFFSFPSTLATTAQFFWRSFLSINVRPVRFYFQILSLGYLWCPA